MICNVKKNALKSHYSVKVLDQTNENINVVH